MCYRLVAASDRRLPAASFAHGGGVSAIDPTPDVADTFPGLGCYAEFWWGMCVCELAGDARARGPRALDRLRRALSFYSDVSDWVEHQVEYRHRPLRLYLCWSTEFGRPPVGTVRWTVDDLRSLDSYLPERTMVEFVAAPAG
jgi:hypothetical protein